MNDALNVVIITDNSVLALVNHWRNVSDLTFSIKVIQSCGERCTVGKCNTCYEILTKIKFGILSNLVAIVNEIIISVDFYQSILNHDTVIKVVIIIKSDKVLLENALFIKKIEPCCTGPASLNLCNTDIYVNIVEIICLTINSLPMGIKGRTSKQFTCPPTSQSNTVMLPRTIVQNIVNECVCVAVYSHNTVNSNTAIITIVIIIVNLNPAGLCLSINIAEYQTTNSTGI